MSKMMFQRGPFTRSEEHTSELQSQSNLVCRLLLEKKHAPAVLDLEVANAIRRLCTIHETSNERGSRAIPDLGTLPVRRYPPTHLLHRTWPLRPELPPTDNEDVHGGEVLVADRPGDLGQRIERAGGGPMTGHAGGEDEQEGTGARVHGALIYSVFFFKEPGDPRDFPPFPPRVPSA